MRPPSTGAENLLANLLEIRDLAVEFVIHGGSIRAVRGVSFDVRAGSTLALVGESGSGKSVTAQSIMGILPDSARITGGNILFNDPATGESVDIAGLAPDGPRMRAIQGGRISIIFQEPMVSLSPLHTVGDQVSECLLLHERIGKSEALERTAEMLRLVGFPDPAGALKRYPFELSGGLRQRAMIAMALISRPALLIADEPTTALDVTIQAQILKLTADLQTEFGMAVLLITHDLGVVANLAEEVVVMYHGEIMESGSVTDIFNSPTHPYLQALLRAVPHFDMAPGERLVPVREIEHVTGPLLEKKRPVAKPDSTVAHLQVSNLRKQFTVRNSGMFSTAESVVTAVDDVSFSVNRGECFGLVGESGSGKTTLSKIIMRAVTADQGRVTYDDNGSSIDVLKLEDRALLEFRPRMQFIFQDPFSSLSPRMTVFDIIREPLVIHDVGDDASQTAMATELMRLVGLDPRFLNRYPHSFSGGQRQRIGIARALALQPDFLICDEPVSALDVSIQAQILNLLKDLQKELGLTYLFISHNLAVVNYVAERIAVMCRGRLVEVAPREQLFSNARHPYTRALLAAVPYPDLERPLNFAVITETGASDPAAWPAPYTLADTADTAQHVSMQDLGGGHFVRAHEGALA